MGDNILDLLADWLSYRGFQIDKYPHGLLVNWWGNHLKKPVVLLLHHDNIVPREDSSFTRAILETPCPFTISGERCDVSTETLSNPDNNIEELFGTIVKHMMKVQKESTHEQSR